ncbi:MAG: DUF4845 domain-containing protein [Burkholderiaceae bacterium]|jgi:hypothetical protein|nr:DUF4845 domain-containing protein [Burkholderiaceae bacterium]
MKHARGKSFQYGISFIGLLVLGVILALVVIVGLRVVPTVTEYMSIVKVAKKVAAEGGDSPQAVRARFDLAVAADYIDAISGKDLQVTQNDDKVVISFAYDKEIPLVRPVYLLIRFSGTTDPGHR